jgi:hypothetical protein
MSSHRPRQAVIRPQWSRRQIASLGAWVDFATYASIWGQSETAARQQHRAGKLPPGVVPVRVGRRWVIPTSGILAALGLGDGGQEIRSDGRDQRAGGPGEQPGDGKATGTPTPAA